VNTGGPAYADKAGDAWAADRVYRLGNWGYLGGSVYATAAGIANTSDQALYQNARIWTSSAVPGYRFPLANGEYAVTLKFAETYWNLAGKRRFTVRIEGTTVLSDFDIFAEAGGKNIALDRTFTVQVSDGDLAIDFVRLSNLDNPLVSAIQVRRITQ